MRVICIKTPPTGRPWGYGWEEHPRVGDVLHVRSKAVAPWSGQVGYTFQEIHNPPAEYAMGHHEIYFMEQYFRQLPDADPKAKKKKKEAV